MSTQPPQPTPGDSQQIITELPGFPNPVRDPDTGMIIPQTRKERRALDRAREMAAAGRAETASVKTEAEEPAPEPTGESARGLAVETAEEPLSEASLPEPTLEPETIAEPAPSRAGRDLPAATATGVVLLGAALVGILWVPAVLAVLVAILLIFGTWEIVKILKTQRIEVAITPLWLGSLALPASAYFGGIDAMMFALFAVMVLQFFWEVVGESTTPLKSTVFGIFILLWVPFLLSFGIVLLTQPAGSILVSTFVLMVVASDLFGYIFGILWGRRAMAPRVSPKKSWEGFAGSTLGSVLVGALAFGLFLDRPWWAGAISGMAIVIAATAGDFSASMFKRDAGVKDYGTSLPGHGGVMDRLDSIVFAAPVAFIAFVLLMP